MKKRSVISFIAVMVLALPLLLSAQEPTALSKVHISGQYTDPKSARDGQTIEAYFKIKNDNDFTVSIGLDFFMNDPSGDNIDDLENRKIVDIPRGERWYSRDYFVNLPPGSETGSHYDAEWRIYEIQDGSFHSQIDSEKRSEYITVNDPIFVRIPMIVYHQIGDTAPNQYWVTQENFRTHMKAMKAYGYTAVTLQDIMDERAGIQSGKKVIITFDDGRENFLSHAYPVISDPQLNFKVTHFIPTARMDASGHLTWQQIRSMADEGLVDFQSHTVNHLDLVTLSDNDLEHEMVASKEKLEQELSREIPYISYPFGSYDTRVQQAAHAAGYFAGLSSYGGIEETVQQKWGMKRVKIIWDTSVNYDNEHPENFFMNRLGDPDVKIPIVTIEGIEFVDPETGYLLANGAVVAGKRIKIRFKTANSGETAPITATLKIDSDTDPVNGVLFDSHSNTPDQDISDTLSQGKNDLEWTWEIPDNAIEGQYYVSLDIHDHHYVLGFFFSGALNGFKVSNQTQPASITVVSPNGGETYLQGQALPIRWSSTGTVGDISIQYKTGGRRWKAVADSLSNSGEFLWTAPSVESSRCRIRIRANGRDLEDRSDSYFTIGAAKIEDQSVSVDKTRDGQTIELGVKITSPAEDTIRMGFDALLISPNGDIAKDPSNRIIREVSAGSHWINFDYLVNLPPDVPGNSRYDIIWQVWTVEGDEFVELFASSERTEAILVEAPIPQRIPVLMYHQIGDSTPDPYWVLTAEFRAQMEALKAYGYTAITLPDLMDDRAGIQAAKKVMLTFDDGWISMYNNAYPILASEGINYKFTNFIYTDAVDWTNFMDWDQIRELHNSGLSDIQSHTLSHPHLTDVSDLDLKLELAESKRILETELNKPVRFISYPYGDYDLRVKMAAHEAGYFAGIAGWGGIEQNSNDKWSIKRVQVLSTLSVDLDKANPENFFMSHIEPEFAVPMITLENIQFLDPSTNQLLSGDQVVPGGSVKIRVTATNSGEAAPVAAALMIDIDGNQANGVAFNSHETNPGQDIILTFGQGQKTFEWIWPVPQNTAPGSYSVQVVFKDSYYVFGFETSSWLTAFTVGGSCTAPRITGQPTGLTIDYNTSATLDVTASGSQPLNYQWYQGVSGDETTPISGADTDTLITPTLTVTSNFWVKVSNSCGSASSQTATVTVNNPANDPGWEAKDSLKFNMIFAGVAYNNGSVAKIGDWLGAFGPGGEDDCRGVATIQESGNFHLTVYSDTESGELITFKLWPLPGGPTINADQTIEFQDEADLRDQTLTFGQNVVQQVKLKRRWNWVSFNVMPQDTSLDAFFAPVLDQITYVKTQFRSASRSENQWSGDLTDMSDISRGLMFLIKTRSAVTLNVVGTRVSSDVAIPVSPGWNWIAYLPQKCLPTVTAIHSVFDNMLEIRSQSATAINENGNLEGDLTEMCPGLGYVIKMNGDSILDYSNSGLTGLLQIENSAAGHPAERLTPWTQIRGNRYNMIGYGSVLINGIAVSEDGYFLAVFGPGGEADCRAVRPISTYGDFYATVLGNRAGESLTYKLFNSHNGQVIETSNPPVNFQPDSVLNDLNIHFKLDNIPTTIELSKQKLIFAATVGQQTVSPKTVSISTQGAGSLSWTALTDSSWIHCTPLSGTGDGQVTVSVDAAGLTAGSYRGGLTVFDSGNPDSNRSIEVELTLYDADDKNETIGSILSPDNGVMDISGNLSIAGWALSPKGIERVTIWRESLAGEAVGPNGLIYLGEADMLEGARPELEVLYPDYPGNEMAGWGYTLLTNLLPGSGNGTSTIHARAEDGSGLIFDLGSRTITCSNKEAVKPFGAITVPGQTEDYPGQLVSYGWALSPAGQIPVDGSTIRVWINGVPVGNPEFGYANSEIDALFPGYANSGFASGKYLINPSMLPSGRHNVSWSVTDSAGNTEQIGTRYFVSQAMTSLSANRITRFGLLSETATIPAALTPIFFRSGYRKDVPAASVQLNGEHVYDVEIGQSNRLEIHFDDSRNNGFKKDMPNRFSETVNWKREFTRNGVLQGYLVVGDVLKPLPSGSTLDRVNNTFYWQPGAAFIGEYHLLFVEGRAGETKIKREVKVRIKNKELEL